jgi:hypothetical protein
MYRPPDVPELKHFVQMLADSGHTLTAWASREFTPSMRMALIQQYATLSSPLAKSMFIQILQNAGSPDEREAFFRLMDSEPDPRVRQNLTAGLHWRVLPEDYDRVYSWLSDPEFGGTSPWMMDALAKCSPERAVLELPKLPMENAQARKHRDRLVEKLTRKLERKAATVKNRAAPKDSR